MPEINFSAFTDELEKIALPFSPEQAALGAAGAKIMFSNTIGRFGTKIPFVGRGLKRVGQEIAGVGARTAMQGKPMVGKALRNAMAVGVDPKLVGLYETAHEAAGKVGPTGAAIAQHFAREGHLGRGIPSMAHAEEFIKNIPLESKGVRKAVDYGFTPVSQVGRDIKAGAKKAGDRIKGSINALRGKAVKPEAGSPLKNPFKAHSMNEFADTVNGYSQHVQGLAGHAEKLLQSIHGPVEHAGALINKLRPAPPPPSGMRQGLIGAGIGVGAAGLGAHLLRNKQQAQPQQQVRQY